MRRIALARGLALGVTACPDEGPPQKVGEKIDETVDKLTHPNEGPLEKAGREAVEDTENAVQGEK